MDWCSEDSLLLIQEYKKYPLLWDRTHKDHFNKLKKNDAWRELAKACNTDVEKVKNKMSSLLGSFRRERAKGKKIIGSGTAAKEIYKSKWFAFKSLLFLIDRNKPRRTESKYVENSYLDVTKTDITEESQSFSQDDSSEEETAENSHNSHGDYNKNLKGRNKLVKSTAATRLKPFSSAGTVENGYIEGALNFQQKPDDPDLVYAQYVANKLKQFSGRTRVLVEHAINEIIFEAEMKLYDSSFVPCNLNRSE